MKYTLLGIGVLVVVALYLFVGRIAWIATETNSDFEVHFEGTSFTLQMVHIKGGTFLMGQPLDEEPRYEWAIEPTEVTVKSFWIGATEVTNGMFRCFDPNHHTREFKGIILDTDRQPVVQVSCFEARRFCEWLSEKAGRNFRLPTEAEWEYACRAGTTSARYWGDNVADATEYESLWTLEESHKMRPKGLVILSYLPVAEFPYLPSPPPVRAYDGFLGSAPVGSFKPNPWGLHDMLGNVTEMCEPAHELKDLTIADEDCIYRGGSWRDDSWSWARCGARAVQPARWRWISLGFRVVCSEKELDAQTPPYNGKDAHRAQARDMAPRRPSSLIDY
jgi:sulfatase modifying factor 1